MTILYSSRRALLGGRTTAANWWDPNDAGLPVFGAWRAINSVGTPWIGGPTAYADSLVNQANPGTNDLTEGNGAVPWAAATGWSFNAAALQYFLTGLVPTDQTWSAFGQFNNVANNGFIFGEDPVGNHKFYIRPNIAANLRCANANELVIAPNMVNGNYAVVGDTPYRNGVNDGGPFVAWAGAPAFNVYIGATNRGAGPVAHITGDIHAVVFYSGPAAAIAAEVAAIVTAMAAL